MGTISLVAFVFGVFGLIAFGQVQRLKREVHELQFRLDEAFPDD